MEMNKEQIAKAKELAERNFEISSWVDDEGMTYFMFNGTKIINPWIDDTGRFDLTDEEAIKLYGLENVLNFVVNILKNNK